MTTVEQELKAMGDRKACPHDEEGDRKAGPRGKKRTSVDKNCIHQARQQPNNNAFNDS